MRDWNPIVGPKKDKNGKPWKGPFYVKFKVWELRDSKDAWRKKRGFPTKAEARAEGDRRKDEWKKKEAGLWNEQAVNDSRPLRELIDEFDRHVRLGLRQRVRRKPSAHAASVKQILNLAFGAGGMGVRTLGELTRGKAESWLQEMRRCRRPGTVNHYRHMLMRFGAWLEDDDIVQKSPFRRLPSIPDDDAEYRMALPFDDVLRVVHGAVQRVMQKAGGRTRAKFLPVARRRALAIVCTYLTFMRADALSNWSWSWIDWGVGYIRIPAEWVKTPRSPRPQIVPLHAGLADLLRSVRRDRAVELGRPIRDDELVVGVRDSRGLGYLPGKVPEAIRADAKFVGIESPDDQGRKLDLNAFRTSAATELRGRGVLESVIDELMHVARKTVAGTNYINLRPEVIQRLGDDLNKIPFEAEQVRGLLFDVKPEAAAGSGPRSDPSSLRSGERGCVSEEPEDQRHAT